MEGVEVSAAAIEVRALEKRYRGGKLAVSGVDLQVEEGRCVALVGPNGAGKSTTIYAILGLIRPTRGSIAVFGRSPADLESRREVGFQPEAFHPYRHLSAHAMLAFCGRLNGLRGQALEHAISLQLQRLGLADEKDRRVGGFSKGMNQRLGLAQALLHGPKLLILDEPTSGLDPSGRRLVSSIILEEKAKGTTLLVSSHILPDVERLCDDVVMLHRGKVAFAGPLAGIRGSLEDLYLDVVERGGGGDAR
jgi:ABC-2 type transport system ATP-binding protein